MNFLRDAWSRVTALFSTPDEKLTDEALAFEIYAMLYEGAKTKNALFAALQRKLTGTDEEKEMQFETTLAELIGCNIITVENEVYTYVAPVEVKEKPCVPYHKRRFEAIIEEEDDIELGPPPKKRYIVVDLAEGAQSSIIPLLESFYSNNTNEESDEESDEESEEDADEVSAENSDEDTDSD